MRQIFLAVISASPFVPPEVVSSNGEDLGKVATVVTAIAECAPSHVASLHQPIASFYSFGDTFVHSPSQNRCSIEWSYWRGGTPLYYPHCALSGCCFGLTESRESSEQPGMPDSSTKPDSSTEPSSSIADMKQKLEYIEYSSHLI